MSAPATRPLYNIDQLLPYVQQGFQLLTPNLRLARRIKSEWDRAQAARGERVWQPLQVHPLETWLRQQWLQRSVADPELRRVPIEQGQALALWRQVIHSQLSAADQQLLQPDAAAAMAQQARNNLLRWQVKVRDEAIAAEFELDRDCATFLGWCRAFESALETRGLATGLDGIALLGQQGKTAAFKAVLLDFDDVPPLFHHCLGQLCSEVQELQPQGDEARLQAAAFADKRSELMAVARWTKDQHEASPAAAIGVVLGDMRGDRSRLEYLLRREFSCLDEQYASLPVNFSTGWPLAEVPVVRDALLALNMTREQVALTDLLAVQRSRFVTLPDRNTPLAQKLLVRLFDCGLESIPLTTVRNMASQLSLGEQRGLALGDVLQQLAQWRELRSTLPPSGWVPRIQQLLALWGWPGEEGLDSLEYQQVEQWHKVLEAYATYDCVTQNLDLHQALKLLAQCCVETMFQPQTSDSPVQVLGPLEAAGLSFDQLWLVGMQANQWPGPARPNPLLPMAMQRRLRMPHASAEREWDFSATLLTQYRRSTPRLYASYSRELDGAPELPSALLSDFTWADMPAPEAVPASWQVTWEQRAPQLLEDNLAPSVTPEELAAVRGGSGLIEDQSHCGFRAFARRRLKVEALSEPSLALNAAERGSLLHDALFALWGELGDAASLLALAASEESALIERAVDAAMAALQESRRLAVGAAYCAQESAHLSRLLKEWLEVERQRADFVVTAREQEATLNLNGLPITLRVDRIDTLPDGSQVIIDYKSGRSRNADWLGERPAKPQLPLYGVASSKPPAALAFAQVRPRECKYVGMGETAAAKGIEVDIPKAIRGKVPCEDWDALRAYWKACLQRLAEDFLTGAAAVDPLNTTSCTWCGLQALCRVEAPVSPPDDQGTAGGQVL